MPIQHVLGIEEEVVIVAFRKHTLLPLDDCLHALQATIPHSVKRYHYDSHAQFSAHLHDFINAYNYGRRLKTLRGLSV